MKAWFPLYVGDFIADTQDFDAMNVGAYMLLLCHAWRHEGQIPADDKHLRTITKLTPYAFSLRKISLLNKLFWDEKFNCYRQKRVEEELAIARQISEVKQKASAAGVAARAAKRANHMVNHPVENVTTTWLTQSQSHTQKEKKGALRAPKEKSASADRATKFPKDFSINETHRAKAAEHELDADREFETFKADAIAKGKRFADWSMAFSAWIGRAEQFNGRNGSHGRDDATIAWTIVEKMVYRHALESDALDAAADAVLHAMGGLQRFRQAQEREIPFLGNEFRERYRAQGGKLLKSQPNKERDAQY